MLDLDGVIRHFDPAHLASVEHRHDIAFGSLEAAAFDPPLLIAAITGAMTRAAWVSQVGEAVGNPAAASEWLADRGTIDSDMMHLVDALRTAGTHVSVLTNGTDTVDSELSDFGVLDRFDAVFSTWDIGWAKPDARAFQHVCQSIGVDPAHVFFTDDSASKLAGAIEIGMVAEQFTSCNRLRQRLVALGVAGASS